MTSAREPIDLEAAARAAMLEHGFEPDFSPAIEREVATLDEPTPAQLAARAGRDLRALPWSSIDNPDSRDLDQVEMVEQADSGALIVRIGVADVDVLVKPGTATDGRASHNTTSVYTGVRVFPMLPERLSTDLTSLNEGEDRLAVVVEMRVTADGEVTEQSVYRALIHNHAKLNYEAVGDWLEGTGPLPEPAAANPVLEAQLRLQHEAAVRLRTERVRRGALHLETIEARPVMSDGRVVDLAVTSENPARDIIESFMVAANGAMARFLESRGMPTLRRVVRTPKRWDRIRRIAEDFGTTLPAAPDRAALAEFLEARRQADLEHFPDLSLTIVKLLGSGEYVLDRPGGGTGDGGHFGLAAAEYTHSTAPNRRFPDLVTQRLVKSVLGGGAMPYSDGDLMDVAARCTEMEDAAKKVERIVRKKAAAALMMDRLGEEFVGIVTGASPKGVWVRLIAPAVEGRVVEGGEALDVGDTVRVRLIRADPARGYIDFDVPSAPEVHRKLERSHRKRLMADRLRGRIGERFRARITGVTDKAVWARTLDGSAEGRVVRGGSGLSVGDEVTLTLIDLDTVHGFIDFECESGVPERKRERRRRKQRGAVELRNRLGARFQAEVTGVSARTVWVRTLGRESYEGRLVRGGRGLEVGDRVPVVLLRVDPKRGWIDFGRDR